MEQVKLTYALFFELETGILVNIYRTKVITPPPPPFHFDRYPRRQNFFI